MEIPIINWYFYFKKIVRVSSLLLHIISYNYKLMRKKKEYPNLISKIKGEIIDKSYYQDVKSNIRSKNIWKYIGDISSTLSHVMLALATILAFAAGFFKIVVLSFLSGCFSTIALSLSQFSVYALKESRERTHRVNTILNKLGISEIPNLVGGSVDINNGEIYKEDMYEKDLEDNKDDDTLINKIFKKFKKSKKECDNINTEINKTNTLDDTNNDIHIDIIDSRNAEESDSNLRVKNSVDALASQLPCVFLKNKRYSNRRNSESDAN